MTVNEKAAILLHTYKNNINAFFTTALGVELDEQQISLLKKAIHPGARIVVRSARGTGKTFLLAGITLWFVLCYDDVYVRVLSPSYSQLTTVFMREVRKLHAKLPRVLAELIEIFSDRIVSKMNPINMAQCVTANADKPENLSGQHADTQVILYDEMSAIEDEVFNITLGSLGTAAGLGYVIGVSNPTRRSGFYAELFEKKLDDWDLFTFNAHKCPRIHKKFIKEQKDLYGEDSDYYRINVLGEFPRADGSVFIPPALVDEALERNIPYKEYMHHEIVMGADIARSRSGDDTVFLIRQGPKVIDLIAFKTDDTMETVARIRDTVLQYKVKRVFIDATGVGGPVGDRARELGLPVIDVVVGSKSTDPTQYFNLRAQLYGTAREWLTTGDLIYNERLKKELSTVLWGYSSKMSIQLKSKKEMTQSPDYSDSFCLSLFPSHLNAINRRRNSGKRSVRKSKYIFA